MYHEVAKQLLMTCAASGTVYEHSQPIAFDGTVRIAIEATVYISKGTGTPSLTVKLQESTDLENWADVGIGVSFSGPFPDYARYTHYDPLMSGHYRLVYKLQEGGGLASVTVLIAAAISISRNS